MRSTPLRYNPYPHPPCPGSTTQAPSELGVEMTCSVCGVLLPIDRDPMWGRKIMTHTKKLNWPGILIEQNPIWPGEWKARTLYKDTPYGITWRSSGDTIDRDREKALAELRAHVQGVVVGVGVKP